jgi:hypothetical protein
VTSLPVGQGRGPGTLAAVSVVKVNAIDVPAERSDEMAAQP